MIFQAHYLPTMTKDLLRSNLLLKRYCQKRNVSKFVSLFICTVTLSFYSKINKCFVQRCIFKLNWYKLESAGCIINEFSEMEHKCTIELKWHFHGLKCISQYCRIYCRKPLKPFYKWLMHIKVYWDRLTWHKAAKWRHEVFVWKKVSQYQY